MSNIQVTEGSGKTVSTETIGSVDYQRIKIVGGETGSTSVLGVTPDGAVKVSVLGTVTVTRTGNASVSGSVGIVGTPSVSGTVAATQQGAWTTSVVGGPIGLFAPTASFISGVTSIITGTTPTSVLLAAGGAIKNYVTHIICSNGAAVGTFVDIKDGGGNVMYSGYAAANGGGFSSHIYPPLVGSANKSVDAASRAQASIIVAMTGYTA